MDNQIPWLDLQMVKFEKEWFEEMEAIHFKYYGKPPYKKVKELINRLNDKYNPRQEIPY